MGEILHPSWDLHRNVKRVSEVVCGHFRTGGVMVMKEVVVLHGVWHQRADPRVRRVFIVHEQVTDLC